MANHRDVGMQISPFSWRDYAAYQQATGIRLDATDIAAIACIEAAFHASRNEAESRRSKASDKGRASL